MASDGKVAFLAARDLLLRHADDYERAVAEFRWPALDRFNWGLDHFDRLPQGQTALWLAGAIEEKLSFGELQAGSNRAANYLAALGVRRGDHVLVLLPNHRALWEAMLGCMKLGAVIIPATTLLSGHELLDRFTRGRVRHVIAAAALAPRIAEVPGEFTRIAVGGKIAGWHDFADAQGAAAEFRPTGETRAADPLLLYFTSGTTAKPKLVRHSHQSYPVGHLSTMYVLGLRPGDVHLNIASPGWAKHAYSSFFAPWIAGATVVAMTEPRFEAKDALDTLVRCGVTTFCGAPTVWRMLVQHDLTAWPVKLREATSAGEPLNPEVIDQVRRAWGLTVRDFYGQTETTSQIGNSPGQPITPGSMGRALPGYRVALLGEDDAEAAEEGEIALALDPPPLGLMPGYQREDGTLQPLVGAWYRTGDVAVRNPDGSFIYVGRADDVFKSSGYRISPFELESALVEHAAVAEAAVVPSEHPLRGLVPKAFVALAAGHEPGRECAVAIFRHLRERVSPAKRVRRLEFFELPKTISGKIRRVELRALERERRRKGERGPAEFWEEDFSELAAS
ncbi:MAG TPA: AMP-binding protein [Stellaceae bacterium]|nr:AMP-binding protein [Stellaceae bacterium]